MAEENKIDVDNAYISEVQKNFKLTKQLEKYIDESVHAQNLSETKDKIWLDIN